MSKYTQEWLKGIALIAFILVVVVFMPGCSSMSIETSQDEFDRAMDQYLPDNVEVNILTAYDMGRKFERKIGGNYQCGMQAIAGQPRKCVINTIVSAEVLLHEICHVIEGRWHGDRLHSGLQGCRSFNYDTLAAMRLGEG